MKNCCPSHVFKAASLARASAAGLPVLPGFVLPTGAGSPGEDVRAVWDTLSDGGSRPLVVRSSSTVEDVVASSMAGRFVSCTDVRGWEAFVDAVATVRGSALQVGDRPAPMGVLVQPMLDADRGGVMFGLGLPELLVILVIVVLLFGAGRLPQIGAGIGEGIRNFKKAMKDKNEVDVTPAKPDEKPKEK